MAAAVAFASEAGGEPVDKTLDLTVEAAVELALMHDIDHEIALLRWENARIDSRIAQAGGPVSDFDRLQREINERQAERNYKAARNNVIIGTVGDYFNLQQSWRTLEIRTREAQVAQEELALVRERVRIGGSTPQEEAREEIRVSGIELDAEIARRNYERARDQFLQRLGLDSDVQLNLTEEPVVHAFSLSLEQVLNHAATETFEAWEREASLDVARLNLENQRTQNPPPLVLAQAENELSIATSEAAKSEADYKAQVTDAYYAVVDARRRIETAEVERTLAEQVWDMTRRQVEAGLRTQLDLKQAEIERLEGELNYYNSLNGYVTARLNLLNLLGMNLGIGREAGGS